MTGVGESLFLSRDLELQPPSMGHLSRNMELVRVLVEYCINHLVPF
jgi:hypothetical protein